MGSPGTISEKIARMAKGQNGEVNIAESFNPVSSWRTNVTDDRQTDDRRICDSKDPNATYHVLVKIGRV